MRRAIGPLAVFPRLAALPRLAAFPLLLGACTEGAAPSTPVAEARSSAPSDGAMCKEHGVLQALCPKCNPKLALIFQAKGDWCSEHGFPESICPICHPELGGRPSVDVTSDGAPADGTKVRFKTQETAELAGIETAKAIERPNEAGIVAVARIAYDATKVALVNARAAGVVRALEVDVGTQVQRGQRLLVVESAAVGVDRSRVGALRARVENARANLEREQELRKKGISSEKEVLLAQQEWETAKAELDGLVSSLGIIGPSSGTASTYALVAPLSGVVTQRNVTPGKLVSVDELLLEIVDTSSMWAEIDIAERDLLVVAAGQSVAIKVDGLEGPDLRGTIAYVAPAIDPKTRTTLARVKLENPHGALRANMFAEARIVVGGSRASVVVPRAAVQRVKAVPLVFVRIAEDEFEVRRVRVSAIDGERVEISKGVRPGEDVATTGSFLLKTETLKGSIGAGCCEADPRK